MGLVILLSVLAGVGSASLVSFVMRCRWLCCVSKIRAGLHELHAAAEVRRRQHPAACWDAMQAGRGEAFEEFLAGFWVEQRQYRRQHRSLFRNREALVIAERSCFRDMPLTNWTEYEIRIV